MSLIASNLQLSESVTLCNDECKDLVCPCLCLLWGKKMILTTFLNVFPCVCLQRTCFWKDSTTTVSCPMATSQFQANRTRTTSRRPWRPCTSWASPMKRFWVCLSNGVAFTCLTFSVLCVLYIQVRSRMGHSLWWTVDSYQSYLNFVVLE